MALGPKELGSWANEGTLSTEIREGAVENIGREELPLLRTSGAASQTGTSGSSSLAFPVKSSYDACVWGLAWEKGWVGLEWWG
jgi:hypothetical protein